MDFPGGSDGSVSARNAGDLGLILGWEDPVEKKMATHSSTLPGKFHKLRSLICYSPWGLKESDTTSDFTFTFHAFLGDASVREPAYQCRRRKTYKFSPWARKIPWRRAWQPIPVFLPGKFHGQRSLACCSPWGCKESDMTE